MINLNSARATWAPVRGFEGTHEISNDGRVRRLACVFVNRRGHKKPSPARMLKPTQKGNGYFHLTLQVNKVQTTLHLHRMVLEAFVGPCPEGMEGLHRNGVKSDNRLDNLRWGTHIENCSDRSRHGKCQFALTYEEALQIRDCRGKMRQVDVAEIYGISQPTVSAIQLGKIWYTDRRKSA